ncbi:MAG: type II toxin-antitoxin system HicB family antitoxin [Chlamydiales bacterium]|nr:type II toxin-antitoxin system HicB family antitoxin [Chlamydiales bacterium]
MLKYKGLFGKVEFDEDAEVFRGETLGFKETILFQAKTIEELESSFQALVDTYLDLCEQRGEDPVLPPSDTFLLKLDPDLQTQLSLEAKAAGMTLNSYITNKLK